MSGLVSCDVTAFPMLLKASFLLHSMRHVSVGIGWPENAAGIVLVLCTLWTLWMFVFASKLSV